MRRVALFVLPAILAAACAPTGQERLRDYNDDGVRLFQRGAYGNARDSFQAALALRPADPDLAYDVGQCYDRLGQPDQAQKFYEQCLAAAPGHVECRHALTVLLWNNGHQDEASRRSRRMAETPSRTAPPPWPSRGISTAGPAICRVPSRGSNRRWPSTITTCARSPRWPWSTRR